jgi:DNA replication and repair protein RecF
MTPYVAHLSLSHFRSHRRTRLDLDGRPVALFGPNGAGKTNLMEAVSLLSPGRGLRRATAEEIIRRPEAIGWKVRASLAGPGLDHEVELSAEPDAPRAVRIDGKSAPQVALARLIRIVWLVPAQDRLWIEGADGRRRFLDRMTMSFLPDHAEDVLTYEKAMRERNRLLEGRGARSGVVWRAGTPDGRGRGRIATNRGAALERLAAAQDGAETAFPAAALDAGGGGRAARGARPRRRLRRGPPPRHGRRSHADRTAPRRSGRGLRRQGRPRAPMLHRGTEGAPDLAVLANARGLKTETGAAPLILLDEVAAHLDAARRAALFDEICALDAQAWMTGTGPELFAELGDRAQHVAVQETAGRVRGHRPVTLTATQLGLYATALFVLFLTPGPVWLATAARALAHGWVAAVPLVLGVALGDALWSVTAALGLAWIVGSYGWVMDVLKWVAVAVFALMRA